jgi:acetolactate synthase-1/2/3 large subunit
LCFGYADPALNETARYFRAADVVLLLGKRLDHRYRYGRPPFFHPAAKLIQVDPSPAEIGRNRSVAVGIAGDIGAVVGQLTAAARSGTWSNASAWVQQLAQTRDAQRRRLDAMAADDRPLHPMRVVREIDRYTDEKTVLVVDGGDFAGWARSYLRARNAGGWLRLGPLGQLGCGVPYAIAAKLARPAADVLLIIGDGSFGFYGIEYDTAVRHGAAFTGIMGNDRFWGIDRNFQLAYYGRAVGTELRTVRYDTVVEALGGHGEYVAEAAGLAPAIDRARASGKPSLVNVTIRNVPCPLAEAMMARRTGKG